MMDQHHYFVSYEFIDSSSNAGIPTGKDARRLIRRQAMSRVAAARKHSGTWGQQLRRQYTIPQTDLQEQVGAEKEGAASIPTQPDLSYQCRYLSPVDKIGTAIPARVPSSGYESMRINYGFDLLDVSALTTFHTGRLTAQLLSREPHRLAQILRYRQWSYLSLLPSRYGHSACLDNAAHCVAARLRQWMSAPSEPPNDVVLSLYSKSLTSLQNALNDPTLCLEPEILCATAILGLYELLDTASDQAWVRHLAGASALIRLRGPHRYQTDFEKALFLAQAGPIYTEALLNDDRCFLEHTVWQNVFRSVVRETDAFSDSSEIVVSLRVVTSPIPSLFKDVQNAVCNSIDIDMRTIENLTARARKARSLLLQWRRQYEEHSLSHFSPQQLIDDKTYDTLASYMANLIIINRLSVSMNPRSESALESETQDLARHILQLEWKASTANPRASLFMAFKIITAQAILDTKDEWNRAVEVSIEDPVHASPLISRPVFENWIRLKGRKVTSNNAASRRGRCNSMHAQCLIEKKSSCRIQFDVSEETAS